MNPWEPFDQLAKTLAEVAGEKGLDMETWALLPGNRACQVVFTIRDDAFLSDDERLLQGIEEATKIAESQHKAKQSIERAKEGLLNIHNKGIFDEDDSPDS